jgi:hypothetical protein
MTLTKDELQKLKLGASNAVDNNKFIQRVDGGVKLNIPVPGVFGRGSIPINLTRKSAKDVSRQVAQGISLGTADEIESYVRSLAGQDRNKALDQIRTEIKTFQQNNPGVALSSEIIGGALTGGLGLGKTAVRTFLKSTGLGGVYSAGKAEPDKDATFKEAIEERAREGAIGAAITAPFAVAGSALQASPVSQKLLKEGVKLSPAQIVGSGASSLERIQAVTPFLGRGARRAREESVISFSRTSANQILNKINKATGLNIKLIKNNQNAQEGTVILNKAINVAYDRTIRPLKINKKETNIENNIANIIENNLSDVTDVRAITKIINKDIFNKFIKKNNEEILTGRNLKNAHSKIRNILNREKRKPITNDEKIDALELIKKELDNSIRISSNPKDYAKYIELDKVYPDYLAYKGASIKGQKDTIEKAGEIVSGAVTPDKLIDEGIAVARKRGKDRMISEGKFPMSNISQTAKPILRSTTLQEELAPFYTLGGQAFLLGGGAMQMPVTTGIAAGTLATLYGTSGGRKLLSEILKRNIAPRFTPFAGAELNERIRN